MERIEISFSGGRRSAVVLGSGALGALAEKWEDRFEEAVVIGDTHVISLFGERVTVTVAPRVRRVQTLAFPGGEENKSRQTKEVLEDQLLANHFSRQTCIVAVGGGISLDVAGFVAATYMRGVGLVNVPTSLLAQVDASIGGKTAVNTPHGKNLIGAFHQPVLVVVDPTLLVSLSSSEWLNGLAEMVKHAFIADAQFFSWIEENIAALRVPHAMEIYPLRRCIEIKAGIVGADEHEEGQRAVLNFGHTVGHAIECATAFVVPHGIAVAAGMMIEARLAARRYGLDRSALARLAQLWPALGFPAFSRMSFESIASFLSVDKKRRANELHLALPLHIGEMAGGRSGTVAVSLEDLREAFDEDLRERS